MKDWVEIAAVLAMIVALGGILYDRIKNKKGIGVRVIQFLAVSFAIPTVLILALEARLSTDATAGILGAIAGYVLSGIGKDEPVSG